MPKAPDNLQIYPRMARLVMTMIGIVLLAGILVLLGWQFDIVVLRRPFPTLVSMNPMTALCFVFLSASFVLVTWISKKELLLYFSQFLLLLVIMTGFSRILIDFGVYDLRVDRFLFQAKMQNDIVNGRPNIMATNTAFCLILEAFAILLLWRKKYYWAQVLALCVAFMALLSIIGYSYGVTQFYGILSFFPMAMHTACCFLLLSGSVLLVEYKQGFMAEVFSPYGGGKLAKVLLPLAILLPFLLGFLRVLGERSGYYQTAFGTALYTILIMIAFVYLIWRSIVYVNKTSHILATEIAERVKIQERLEASNRFRETILENIPDTIFVKEAEQLRYVSINKAGEELLGLTREKLTGKTDFDLFSEEQARAFRGMDMDAFTRKTSVLIEEVIIGAADAKKILQTKKIPVFDAKGTPLYIVGISEDITEKKSADNQLRESAHQIFDLYNNAPCGYHSIDPQGIVLEMNNTELKWLGYSRNEVIGVMNIIQFIDPNEHAFYWNNFEKFKKDGRGHELEFNLIRKDGGSFPVLLSGSAVYDKDGNFVKSRTMVFDFTERKALEKMVLKFNRELEDKVNQRTEELAQRAHELSVSNAELEQFAYVASHDLQEPLRMVTSFLAQLEKKYKDQLDDKALQYIHYATDGALRMRKIILDLLEYSRAGKKEFEREETNVNEVMENVVTLIKVKIAETRATVEWDKLPVIRAAKAPLQQVFQNLVSNAMKYQQQDSLPVVRISARELTGYWQFSVSDNGIGIEPQFYDKIFIIFQRLHTRDEYSGTGIGLAICKKIVEMHKGKIWVESKPGQGSTFHFTINKV